MKRIFFPKNYFHQLIFLGCLICSTLTFFLISFFSTISAANADKPTFKISASPGHILFIDEAGILWSWGKNDFGQLGDGGRKDHFKPVRVTEEVVEVAAGLYHSMALKKDGTLLAWGRNNHGQLGNGGMEVIPKPVIVMDNVKMIAAGSYHSLAVTRDGTLWAWGNNKYGQIGDGSRKDRPKPVNILSNVADICAGSYQSFAIDEKGNLYAWGRNLDGRLGDGTNIDRTVPVKVLDNVVKVSAGNSHTLALRSNKRLFAWGSNIYGQIGDRTRQAKKKPVPILRNVIDIGAGAYHSMALMQNGKLWAWGANSFGQLGDGTTIDKKSPVRVKISKRVTSFTTGPFQAFAFDRSKTLWGWGRNNAAQLYSSNKAYFSLPIEIDLANYPTPSLKLTRIAFQLFKKPQKGLPRKNRTNKPKPLGDVQKISEPPSTSVAVKDIPIKEERISKDFQAGATEETKEIKRTAKLEVSLESRLTTRANTPVATNIEVNDIENALARVVVLKQPLHGTVRVDAHQLLYMPESGYQGEDSVILVFIGKHGETMQKKVDISILPGNLGGNNTLGLKKEFSSVSLAELSHFLKAQQLAEAGKPFMAIEEYKKAIAADDNRLQAYWNLSMVQYQLGFVDDAIKTLEKAVDTGAPADFLYLDLGIFYFGKGLYDKAQRTLFQALELNPGLTDAYYYLGMLFQKRGKCQMAWLFAKTAKKLGHRGKTLFESLDDACKEPEISPWQMYEDHEFVYMRQISVESLDKAKAILDEIRQGELFEIIAGRESNGPYAMVGGYAGRFRLSELEPNIAQAMQAQAIFGPPQLVKTTEGFLIVQRIAPFEFPKWKNLLQSNATNTQNSFEE